MNKTFRIIWSEARKTWVAASEVTGARGKRSAVTVAVATLAATLMGTAGLAQAGVVNNGESQCMSKAGATTWTCQVPNAQGGFSIINGLPDDGTGAAPDWTAVNAAAAAANTGKNALLLGDSTTRALGERSIAIGVGAQATGTDSLALGVNSTAKAPESVALGFSNTAGDVSAVSTDTGNVAVGVKNVAKVTGIAVGSGNTAIGSTAIGGNNVADGGGVAMGWKNTVSSPTGSARSAALGFNNTVSSTDSVALGSGNTTSALFATAVGLNNTVAGIGAAIGVGNTISKNASGYVLGSGINIATGVYDAVALGGSTQVTLTGGVALGQGSVANTAAGVLGYDPSTGTTTAAGSAIANTVATRAAVNVGSRQITGVAAGAADTDAVNVAQLRAVSAAAATGGVHYYHVNDGGAHGGNYANDGATGVNAIAAGVGAKASGSSALAMGDGATAAGGATLLDGYSSGALAMGTQANASGAQSIAIGAGSKASDQQSVALGMSSNASGLSAVAIGRESAAAGRNSAALGIGSNASGSQTLALGNEALASGSGSTAIGTSSIATGVRSIASGVTATASGLQSVAMGAFSSASVDDGVALGSSSTSDRALAPATGSIPAGSALITYNTADRTLLGAVSVGSATTYRQITNVADGTQDQDAVTVRQLSGALQSFAVTPVKYFHANSNAADSLAIGAESVAVGPQTVVNGNNGVGIGNGAVVHQSAPGGIAIGQSATSHLADSIALGTQSSAAAVQGVAIGAGTSVTQAGGVALGAGAVASTAAGVAGYVPATATESQRIAIGATTSTLAAVSVGDAANGQFRQITGVAAGAADSDAVNVSQLKAVQSTVAVIDQSVVKYDTNVDGSTNYDSVTMGGGNSTGPVAIHNVAPGVAPTDAVNVQQLNGAVGNINNRIDGVENKLNRNTRMLSGGIAASAAMAVVTPVEPGRYHVSGALAGYNGEAGIGFNVLKRSDNGQTTLHAGVGWGTGGGKAIVRVGFGFSFD